MPIKETCLVCSLDLIFVPGHKEGSGQYYHDFSNVSKGKYLHLHVPVPSIEDPSIPDDRQPSSYSEKSFGFPPRASVMPQGIKHGECSCQFCRESA